MPIDPANMLPMVQALPRWLWGTGWRAAIELSAKVDELPRPAMFKALVSWRVKDEMREHNCDLESRSYGSYSRRKREGTRVVPMDTDGLMHADRGTSDRVSVAYVDWHIDGSGHEFLNTLNDTERIVVARTMQGATNSAIGHDVGCSTANVCLIRRTIREKYADWIAGRDA